MFVVCEFGSRGGHGIFGLMFMGSVMLFICRSSCVLYSAGSGVKRVHAVLCGLRMRLLSVSMYVIHVRMIDVCICYVYAVVC